MNHLKNLKNIINDDDIKIIEEYLTKKKDTLIKNEKIGIKDNIFKILNKNENIMYKYIKDIDHLIGH